MASIVDLLVNTGRETADLPFDAWRQEHFSEVELADSSISGAEGSPMDDGIPNLLKYALGYGPRETLPRAYAALHMATDVPIFRHNRPAQRSDIAYQVEVSTDMTNWGEAGVTHEKASDSNGLESWQASIDSGNSDATRFFRLKVTQLGN